MPKGGFAGKPKKPAGGSNKGAMPYGKAVSAAAKAKKASRKKK